MRGALVCLLLWLGHENASLGQQPKRIATSNRISLVLVPAGTFMMGSPETEAGRDPNEPQHQVTITNAFYLGVSEVTQGQWESIMKTTPWKGQELVEEGKNFAASYISWEDAVEFCKRLSEKEGRQYRLPTEAEWEYACRAGTTTAYSFGDTWANITKNGWCKLNTNGEFIGKSEQYPHEVRRKRPNRFGLYDMHGNVWEWCSDWYGGSYYRDSPAKDPMGPSSGVHHIFRGGSWRSPPEYCRSAGRGVDERSGNNGCLVGFRVAADK